MKIWKKCAIFHVNFSLKDVLQYLLLQGNWPVHNGRHQATQVWLWQTTAVRSSELHHNYFHRFWDTRISVLQKVPTWPSAFYILNEHRLWININDNDKNIHCHFNSNWNLAMCMSWWSGDWISAGASFRTHPDWSWDPPSLLDSGYQGIPGGTEARAWH